MKILLVNWRCIKNPEAGGAEIHMHEIFKRVASLGHSVTLVAHDFKGAANEEIIDGIKHIRIGNKYLFDKQFKKFYNKELINEDFDLVVDYITKIPLNTPTYIKRPLIAVLMHIHGKSLFKELFYPLAYYIYKKERKIPKYYRHIPFCVISPSSKTDLSGLGIERERIELLYSGIDQKLFNNPTQKNPNPTLLYFGRLKKYKNVEIIIDALHEVIKYIPDIKLEIAGYGDHEENLKNYVFKKKLNDYVVFHGKVSEEEKAGLMGKAWLLVLMSYKEGWGIVVIEANACYTPAIGSDVHGLRDSISPATGILTPVDNTSELAKNIIDLIQDKEKLKKMSLAAKEWSKNFTWDISAEHFIKVIHKYYPHLKNK